MLKNTVINNDEINLTELLIVLWDGKWKIVLTVVISVTLAMGYLKATPNNFFKATTKIKPITSIEERKYSIFFENQRKEINKVDQVQNDTFQYKRIFNFFQISKEDLLEMYIDVLKEGKLFEDAIEKFKLLDSSKYSNSEVYKNEIVKLASLIKIEKVKLKKQDTETSYTVNFEYDDVKKWIAVMLYVDETANKDIKQSLVSQFDTLILIAKNDREYKLEDVRIKIENQKIDYERENSDRISFLKEQSEIASKLGIAKNSVELQLFGNESKEGSLYSSVNSFAPFYLRGYEAINKEIELRTKRTNIKAFTKGLFELEKKLREIEQSKSLERFETSFALTPLFGGTGDSRDEGESFYAAKAQVVSSKFSFEDRNSILYLAIFIGFMIGLFYVYISNAQKFEKISRKK